MEALTERKSWKLGRSHGPAGTSRMTFIFAALRERLLWVWNRFGARTVKVSDRSPLEIEGKELLHISKARLSLQMEIAVNLRCLGEWLGVPKG